MDKLCEYCKALRPIVYCKADAAHLCLSCDVKIHSANALSNRHTRTLICESCRCRRAYIQCSNHRMFMCRSCDRSQHDVSSQHRRCVISSYIGCPSPNRLAALWGFDLNDLDSSTRQDQFVSALSVSAGKGSVNCNTLMQSPPQVASSSLASGMDFVTSHSGAEYEVGLSSEHTKAFYHSKQQGSTIILQQILDLKRVNTDDSICSSFIRRMEQTDISSSENETTSKLENHLDQQFQQSLGLDSDIQQIGNHCQDLHIDPFPLPFSQLDHLTSSSTGGNPLQGDSFWQGKSPVWSGQLWSQNMQDLGVCEELGCLNDLSIPEIDLTFRNFEELFLGEQEPINALPDDMSTACSSVEKDISFDRSKLGYARGMEDTTPADSVCAAQSDHVDIDIGPSDRAPYSSRDCPDPIRASYSTLSFSLSMLSAESSGSDYVDSGLSPVNFIQEPSCNSLEIAQQEGRENVRTRYKEKKKKVGRHEKQVQYASRKARADIRKEAGKRPICENRRL